MNIVKLEGTTDADGDLTVDHTTNVIGRLIAIEWIDGTFADGVDAVISTQERSSGVAQTLLTLTNANDDKMYYPRAVVHDDAGADVTYDGTNEIYEAPLISGKPRMVVSSGGDTKTGGCILYIQKP